MLRNTIDIFIDGDACPVKNEVYRVAERHKIITHVVCNRPIKIPQSSLISLNLVSKEMDSADKWIVGHVSKRDIVITSDIPLADLCVKKEVKVLRPNGKVLDEQNIGSALAMRNLMQDIQTSEGKSQMHRPFNNQDRVKFLNALEKMIQADLRNR
ncbi:MAG: hypothetical protein CMM30_04255 [Rhodospirillaceae bacterium]|nr:hypothetical protein [Rhodospirillaceae bacterium]|tara:strand:- start:956 stop:1420 length:465 start_codon:yes stop_codon:yes gene_type:complete